MKTTKLDIGAAVTQLKSGRRVRRAGWNGKGMYIYYVPNYAWTGHAAAAPVDTTVHKFRTCPFVAMKMADDTLVPWQASQTDLLAEDWEIVL